MPFSFFENYQRVTTDPRRLPGLDYLRALAIIGVALFHFYFLPYGFLGVDIFFAISGFLVGGQLLERISTQRPLRIQDFYLARATKIWPSYLFFLAAAGIISYLLYSHTHSRLMLQLAALPKYLFLYLNYSNQDGMLFAHVWSLCIEEHFYLVLPLFFLILGFFKIRSLKTIGILLFIGILGVGFLRFKLAMSGHETVMTTHTRIDGMLWGMLAWITRRSQPINRYTRWLFFIIAASMAGLAIHADGSWQNDLYSDAFFHGLIAFAAYFLLLAVAELNLKVLKPLGFISYFSFNFYLWHLLFYQVIRDYVGRGWLGLIVYLSIGLLAALVTTVWVEEPGMKLRRRFLPPAEKSPIRPAGTPGSGFGSGEVVEVLGLTATAVEAAILKGI